MKLHFLTLSAVAALAMPPLCLNAATTSIPGYSETKLVSNLDGAALHKDPRALNSWGIIVGSGILWVNQNHSGVLVPYGASGAARSPAVNIPGPAGSASAGKPTGLEFNSTAQFVITNGHRTGPSSLLIATEDGTIAAWNQKVTGSDAVIAVDRSGQGAIYKGLAIVPDATGAPLLFAADFHNGKVDVFNGRFEFQASFTDATVPGGFAPFNVKNIRGYLFVTFARQFLPDAEDDQPGPGNGYVDIFDTDGTLLRRFASQGALNSPWDLVVAPINFGKFSRSLLVGNFGDGRINAYDLLSGKPLGRLTMTNGMDVVIPGLWGLSFDRKEAPGRESLFVADRLYYTAGPNGEEDGVIGYIRVPASRSTSGGSPGPGY